MSAKGKFFAIGQPQWDAACELGINVAVALLVLALGTGHDNQTTSWSAKAIEQRMGIGWRRAKLAISSLLNTPILTEVKSGSRPRYKIAVPEDQQEMIWLPNELIVGAANEVPPIARIRQTQDVALLSTFVSLYSAHDLPGDGGLPRDLIRDEFDREQIATHGQYVFYGFRHKASMAWKHGPFAKYLEDKKDKGRLWQHIRLLESIGLLESVRYLAESGEADAELIHPLTGDAHALATHEAIQSALDCRESYITYKGENFDFVLPVLAHMTNAAIVGVYRLVYRPKTLRTAAWYGRHVEQCASFAAIYSQIFQAKEAA